MMIFPVILGSSMENDLLLLGARGLGSSMGKDFLLLSGVLGIVLSLGIGGSDLVAM